MSEEMVQAIVETAKVLTGPSDISSLIGSVKDKKIVMLGESSHGTQEFYEWRKRISLELIRHHGFSFIAVEGDWPPCEAVNCYVKMKSDRDMITSLREFSRWPTWMWANTVMMELMDELRELNENGNAAGFHGLDVYSLYESLDVVLAKLREIDPALASRAADLYGCLGPFRHDERAYVRSLLQHPDGCKSAVLKALQEILEARLRDENHMYDIIQNAKVVKNAEQYYRAMMSVDEESWNVRDGHMMETLASLLAYYGADSKAIVWAHNTHIGDYRATDMLISGEVNLGGLAREQYGAENIALVGFTTYTGEVIASTGWDGPVMKMKVPPSPSDTLEGAFHEASQKLAGDNLLVSFHEQGEHPAFRNYTGHRAIGVVYHPEFEARGNYVPTKPGERYDHMVFIHKTHALVPLNLKADTEKIPETYPYGDRI